MILKRQMETRLGEEFEEHAEGKEDTDTEIYITFFREKEILF